MSLQLWDKEFNVQVSDEIISREHQCIVVNIIKRSGRFTFPVIKEELLEMVEYMDSEGWEIFNIELSMPNARGLNLSSSHFKCYLEGDKLLDFPTDREITEEFDQLIVKFIEKEVKTNESTEEDIHRELMIKKYGSEEIEECDEVIRNISDMLLELEDLGLSTLVGYSPMTIVSIDPNPKISVEIKGPVELFDSNSELIHNIGDQIKDYVKDYKFVTGSGEWVETLGILHQIKKYLILIQK